MRPSHLCSGESTPVRLLLAIESDPADRSSSVPPDADAIVAAIRATGGEVRVSGGDGATSFIALASWSDWRAVGTWWSTAYGTARGHRQRIEVLVLREAGSTVALLGGSPP